MTTKNTKSGPIHYYPTENRDADITHIVEYCVQLGERQPLTASQSVWLVASKQVLVDGRVACDATERIAHGTWEVSIRGKKHHVVVHPALKE